MKNIRKYLILTLAAIIISSSMLVAADTGTNQNSSIKSYKVINSTGFEPHTLDFQTSSSVAEVEVSSKVMEGLMRRNGQDIIPGIASRYEVSKDGLTYTFYLRDALWSDGKPVTAYDFAYAWKRALDPKVASEYAFLMYYIKNAELFNNGKIAESQLGIKVLNNKTLQVVLENPTPYFIDLTTTMTYMPARKDLIDKYKEKYFNGSMPLVVNGPFKLAAWERGHVIRYEKNPKYWNAKNIKIDIINAYVYFLNNDALQDYYDNNLDAMIIKGNESNIPKNEIKNNYSGTVWYVQFNNSDKAGILSNANIRKALSLSINRQEFLKLTGRETADPALSLVAPEIIPGKEKPFREEAGDLIKDNDLQAAKAALSLGLKEKKLTKLPELTLLISSGVISEKQGEVLTQMWKENLGINVKVVTKSFGEQMSEMYKGNYQMAIAGWGADYLDAMTYLEMFDSSVQPNQFGYKNTEFNSLIKSIKNEADTSKRIDLLKKAEKKLINEAVVAPLYFLYEKTAIKPNIKNVQFSPTGAKFDFTFADVVELERTFETADSKFSMKTNQNWHKQRVDDLDLMLIDSVDPIWVTVSSFSSTGSTSELNTYVDMEIKSRLKTSDSSKLIQKEKVRINSLEAVKYQISLSSSYLERVIYGVFISTPDKVYKVQFFAYPDVFQQRKAEIDKMINSITVAR